jgi:predicted acetyltransferase
MTNTTIRQLHGDEMLEAMNGLNAYAFRESPPFADKAEWQEVMRHREGFVYYALLEDDIPVAGAASGAMAQQVRGALFGAGGIWAVATHPAARRKGYSRAVMARLLAAVRDSGQPLSCLYPFRESFYQRLGYVTFPLPRMARLTPLSLLPLLNQDLGGQVDLVLIGDGFDAYRDYLHTLRQRTHGMALFDHPDHFSARHNKFWLAVARVGGQVAGVMLYDLRGSEVGDFVLRAFRFYYDTAQAKYLLLQWIARHADQASQVEISLAPFELPETWLADIKVTTQSDIRAPMGRVVDVARLGGMHTGPGRFTVHVTDPLCPWNEKAWQFETVDGVLQVIAADASAAGCDLSIQGLAALVYGAHDPGDYAIRGWGNPTPELQAAMRSIFPPTIPHLHERF